MIEQERIVRSNRLRSFAAYRDTDQNLGSFSWRAFDSELSADARDPFLHASEAVMIAAAGRLEIKSHAVIGQRGAEPARGFDQLQMKLGCAGVAHAVENRLAEREVELPFNFVGPIACSDRALKIELESGPAAKDIEFFSKSPIQRARL